MRSPEAGEYEWAGLLVETPRRRASWLIVPIFGVATLGAYLGQAYDRPISAPLIYLLGVLVIGAGWGLWLGVASAVAASIIYNFFLSQPLLQFSFTSADEYIPLIAFNVAALLSGVLAGRLNDRARAAEQASGKLNLLLELSRKLQEATDLAQIDTALRDIGSRAGVMGTEIFVVEDAGIRSVGTRESFRDVAEAALTHDGFGAARPDVLTLPLIARAGILGVLVHPLREETQEALIDWPAASALLAMAIERLLLLRAAAEKEGLRRSEEFKSALLASVSHDLRTPLAAITASATSLRSYGEQIAEGDRQSMLAMIQEQCERLNRYTANLLSLGRLQSAVDEAELDTVDLVELLGTALAAIRSAAPERAFDKQVDVAAALVRGNPVMIEQVLLNVMENAVRYSNADKPIEVGLVNDGERAIVSVTDQGRGIPPAELGRIFERFYRSASSAGVEGQGLGLSIAKGVAERFGGAIRAISPVSDGGGTRIEIAFPTIPDAAA